MDILQIMNNKKLMPKTLFFSERSSNKYIYNSIYIKDKLYKNIKIKKKLNNEQVYI